MPFESLKRTTRDRKYAIDELKETLKQINGAASGGGDGGASSSSSSSASREETVTKLEGCMRTLQHLKRKLDEASVVERDDAQRCRARLEHLQTLGQPARDAHIEWNRQRLDRLLIDYMLRCGYLDAAARLVKQNNLDKLTDIHIFEGAQPVLLSLQRHECGEALQWCTLHAARLKKAKSPLEFQLRVQQFVEMIRGGDMLHAITHARKFLAPWATHYPAELQRAAALLAFRGDTPCAPYASLLSMGRWQHIIDLFKSELFKLHSLPPTSQLEIHVQAGLSSLKTPQSLAAGCGARDPLHLPAYRTLAEKLPFAKHVHSKVMCALTGEVISEHNPPAALPNGYVYSQAGLEAMAAADGGKVTCPNTGATYLLSDLRRVFIM